MKVTKTSIEIDYVQFLVFAFWECLHLVVTFFSFVFFFLPNLPTHVMKVTLMGNKTIHREAFMIKKGKLLILVIVI